MAYQPEMSEPREPIDWQHLARYTMGDLALERELIELFLSGAAEYLSVLGSAQEEASFHRAAHSLKGSARGIGALVVGDLAAVLETMSPDSPDKDGYLEQLDQALAAVRDAASQQGRLS